MKAILLLLSLSLFSLNNYAQADNQFWFAAPDISSDHGNAPKNGAPIYLHVTAVQPTTVTISQPGNPSFTPVIFVLGELEHRAIQLDNLMGIDQIENYPQPLPQPPSSIQKKAFKITSYPGDITVYYELDNYYNREIFTLKGKNALGNSFFVSTQNQFPNGNYNGTAWSGFVVAATENNTRVVVYPNDDWMYFDTNPGDSVVLILNAGETFAFRAASTAADRHINGVPVKSDKNIVITVYDDSIRKKHTNNATCAANLSYDLIGDQIIPTGLTGKEYIVIKGQVTLTEDPNCPADGGERIFITSTMPGTDIFIDGILVTHMASAGQVFSYPVNNATVHVKSSFPVYLNHITGFGGELGGAVLPPADEGTGSYHVAFTRTPNVNDAFIMNLMVRNDTAPGSPNRNQSIKNFTLFSNGIPTVIPETYFDFILDSTWAVLKKTAPVNAFISGKILPGNSVRISNSVARFHLGVINGGTSTGCKYGYFSNYSAIAPSAGIGNSHGVKMQTICSMDSTLFVAEGGYEYKWIGITNPADTILLSSTNSGTIVFKPVSPGDYMFGVSIYGDNFNDTIFLRTVYAEPNMADMELPQETCPGELFLINNNGFAYETTLNIDGTWHYNIELPYSCMFENNTNSSIIKKITLLTQSASHACPNLDIDSIIVHPAVHADFQFNGTEFFVGDTIRFVNQSTGKNLSYLWNFGDGISSTDTNATHLYTPESHAVFAVRLIATSESDCSDSIIRSIKLLTPISQDSIPVTISSNIFHDEWELDEPLCLRITETLTNKIWYDSLAVVTKAFGFNDTVYLDSGIYKCEILYMGANVSMPVIKFGNHVIPWGYPQYEYYLFTLPGVYNSSATIWETACDSLVSPSSKYIWYTSGIYLDTIPNAQGFDSLMTVHATIKNKSFSTLNETACFSYISPAGAELESSGTYMETIANAAGCDSVITINLNIINVDNSVDEVDGTLIALEPEAEYQWLVCTGQQEIEGQTYQNYPPVVNGLYSVRITKNGCTVTSDCYSIIVLNDNEIPGDLSWYPNPVTDELNIDLEQRYRNIDVKIYDMAGKMLFDLNCKEQDFIRINTGTWSRGMYFVQIHADNSHTSFRIVK